ncbi:MAG: ribonuclease T2 [Pseudomonadota bacterium]
MRILLLVLALLAAPPAGAGDRAGDFTHYIVALSWNASWCAAEGDARDAPQCDPRHDHGWVLHGLWPQGDRDWPENCATAERDPSRTLTDSMADVFGSRGLAWYQWKKHGRCAGIPARAYFDLAREAYGMIRRPDLLRQIEDPLTVSPDVIEKAFLEENPALRANQLAVTCRDGLIREVRVCVSKALVPRTCTLEVERGCRARTAIFPPMR